MRRGPDRADVVVQGAGVVGLTTAVALARQGLSVTLLDRRPPPGWQGGAYRLRVASINRGSEAVLSGLGAWARLPGWRAAPVRRVEAADRHDGPLVAFDAADVGEPHLAHIVENDLLLAALADTAALAGVRWQQPAAVVAWSEAADGLELVLDDGGRLHCRLLVGADGADSAVREAAGIVADRRSYGQRGLVAVVEGGRGHGGTARQRFLPGGPLALLPLPEGLCSIVWSLPEAEAQRLEAVDDYAFREALSAAAGDWLGEVRWLGPRASFPLQRLHAGRYVGTRVALVGDAAHVIHPLAGQGANLGIADASSLASVVAAAADQGRDPGRALALRRYERRRRGENTAAQWAMDAFHHGFNSDMPPVRGLRRLGFAATARSPAARRLFMRHAMGLG